MTLEAVGCRNDSAEIHKLFGKTTLSEVRQRMSTPLPVVIIRQTTLTVCLKWTLHYRKSDIQTVKRLSTCLQWTLHYRKSDIQTVKRLSTCLQWTLHYRKSDIQTVKRLSTCLQWTLHYRKSDSNCTETVHLPTVDTTLPKI